VRLIRAHRHDRQRGALPQILVLDFRHRHVELLQAVLHAPEHHPLVLERPRSRHVHLDGQQRDDHC
jgi:hypothetical protein